MMKTTILGTAAALLIGSAALVLVALACIPARIHVTVGSTEANLLVPLYGVVAAAAFPAYAHHSFAAEFDAQKQKLLQST